MRLIDGIQDFLVPETDDALKLIEHIPAVIEPYALDSNNVPGKAYLFI